MAAVRCVPELHYCTDFTNISFGIIGPVLATLKLKYRLVTNILVYQVP